MVEPREWLIRKGNLFYRPNRSGYTTRKVEAGRYTKAEADEAAAVEPWHMSAVHQDEVPDEPAVADLQAEVERLTLERDELRGIVARCCNSLPNGAYCSPDASMEFLRRVPGEVLLVTTQMVDRIAAAERALAERPAVIPPDWRLVPEEPTEEMLRAGDAALCNSIECRCDESAIYRAMLSASPPPPDAAGWRPIETAPKDGTVIWAVLRSDIYPGLEPQRDRLKGWNGVQVPLRHGGLAKYGFDVGWAVAAPVGHGGFSDAWIAGWMPLPPAPEPSRDHG